MSRSKTAKSSNSYISQADSARGSLPVKIPVSRVYQVSGCDPLFCPVPGERSSDSLNLCETDMRASEAGRRLALEYPVHISVVMSEVMHFNLTYDSLNLPLTGEVD